jgi:hypothetical protein
MAIEVRLNRYLERRGCKWHPPRAGRVPALQPLLAQPQAWSQWVINRTIVKEPSCVAGRGWALRRRKFGGRWAIVVGHDLAALRLCVLFFIAKTARRKEGKENLLTQRHRQSDVGPARGEFGRETFVWRARPLTTGL